MKTSIRALIQSNAEMTRLDDMGFAHRHHRTQDHSVAMGPSLNARCCRVLSTTRTPIPRTKVLALVSAFTMRPMDDTLVRRYDAHTPHHPWLFYFMRRRLCHCVVYDVFKVCHVCDIFDRESGGGA
ncbi:uncharacterized protein BDZ83DRAFT_621185 [Colletotrichum acutatum]|uniref:Uncharacterized protein n=1 Tax=Glomerella acutata TaxID=27357 RepID=A0AAD8UNQ7_GLOAC|nr:uncharacterized protein BDZ83DRAFT_621185 [Colletotrichum acutatum]KAK1724928.1 hypothetical protein BDZ83DRAFT_621185 [Colletotrichum acutatum]